MLFISNLQRIEVRPELIQCRSDVAGPVGIGTGETQRGVLLVGVQEALQFDAVIADIGDVEQRVLGQGALHADEEALNVAVLGVFGDVGDVIGCRVEGGDKAARVALVRGGVAGRRCSADGDNLGGKRGEQWFVVSEFCVTEAN